MDVDGWWSGGVAERMSECCRSECSSGTGGHVRFLFEGGAVECQEEKIELILCS